MKIKRDDLLVLNNGLFLVEKLTSDLIDEHDFEKYLNNIFETKKLKSGLGIVEVPLYFVNIEEFGYLQVKFCLDTHIFSEEQISDFLFLLNAFLKENISQKKKFTGIVKNNDDKIVKTIITIINEKIPKKIEKLERKHGIGIHTCNFTQKVKLSNGVILNISINNYRDTNKDTNSVGYSKGDTYDIFFGDDDGIYLVNSSNNYDSYSHDLEGNSEYFEVLEKVCEIMNNREQKEINGKSVSEILSKMK